MLIGIPLGIIASRSNTFEIILRPILDIMQTIPSFVYLIPVVMLFGVGLTPGVVATIIFALPPIIRLTNLGIRQVGKGFKEAGSSLGLTRFLILIKIEIPLSLKTIMAGVNQTLMLALSMVVIAALIGAGGLGLTVYIALGRLDVGSAVIGGTGIVILAIILDRITQKIIKITLKILIFNMVWSNFTTSSNNFCLLYFFNFLQISKNFLGVRSFLFSKLNLRIIRVRFPSWRNMFKSIDFKSKWNFKFFGILHYFT